MQYASSFLVGAGTKNLTGKIVLDASNPLDFSSGRPGLFVGTTDSLGERI
jgi:predicted dinucleotide-binding enzyme